MLTCVIITDLTKLIYPPTLLKYTAYNVVTIKSLQDKVWNLQIIVS